MKSIWKEQLKENLIAFIESQNTKEVTTIDDAFEVLDEYMFDADDETASSTIERVLLFLEQDENWFRNNASPRAIQLVKKLNSIVN